MQRFRITSLPPFYTIEGEPQVGRWYRGWLEEPRKRRVWNLFLTSGIGFGVHVFEEGVG